MNKLSNEKKKYGIIMAIFASIALAVGVYSIVCMATNTMNTFVKYYAIAAIMCSLSVVAFFMPLVANQNRRYAGDQSKDNLIFLAAIALFILGLLSILMCYMGVFNIE